MTNVAPSLLQDPQFVNQIAQLARATAQVPGKFYPQFVQAAQAWGMTAPQLAATMGVVAQQGGAMAAEAALVVNNGVRAAQAYGLMGSMSAVEASMVAEAITVSQAAAAGTTAVATTGAAAGTAVATQGGGGLLATLAALPAAAKIALAAAAVLVAAGVGQGLGVLSADDPVESPFGGPRTEQQTIDDAINTSNEQSGNGVTQSRDGFAVIRVTNHSSQALSVQPLEAIDRHESGEAPFLLCHFLHGGRCADYCFETGNGDTVCGQDVPASISIVSEHSLADGGVDAAWESLCSQVGETRAAALAEGWVGEDGTTIDWANFIWSGRPCS